MTKDPDDVNYVYDVYYAEEAGVSNTYKGEGEGVLSSVSEIQSLKNPSGEIENNGKDTWLARYVFKDQKSILKYFFRGTIHLKNVPLISMAKGVSPGACVIIIT